MLSVFDIFKVGIGPSSSHTVGPMRAAHMFVSSLQQDGLLPRVSRIEVELFGSLGATGKGHATDKGIMFGLLGELPESVEPQKSQAMLNAISQTGNIKLLGIQTVRFDASSDIKFLGSVFKPEHPNAMRFCVFTDGNSKLSEREYFSIGGGFVLEKKSEADKTSSEIISNIPVQPWPFASGDELLALTYKSGLSISELVLANEVTRLSEHEVRQRLLHIWNVMQQCVRSGFGIDNPLADQPLPGILKIPRRAAQLRRDLLLKSDQSDPLAVIDWVNAYAMAVNEENAAGSRVVTAPTNGAAGIIPAVLHYYINFVPGADDDGVVKFLLTAAAIGMLYKTNASISGAEVGCQGEVGVACSMAAGALAAVLGGSPSQVENAAEIGMEHNLGLTCDPVGGLVQIPCVERNAMGAVKAINAARMSLRGDGQHFVSLDAVIKTMKQTGDDMKNSYKETSLGGLAVNVVAC